MAVPKRKISKSRRDNRRNHVNVSVPALSNCTNCGEMTRPHRVCRHCGYFKGVQVMEVKQQF
jgi:large subunit ribosomal protein L32